MKLVFPTRAIMLLMLVGIVDLVSTAWMHAKGQIVELNPLMRFFIEQSEWLFAAIKGLTLVVAWVVLAWYCQHNRRFVRNACVMGTAAYVLVWTTWFLAAR